MKRILFFFYIIFFLQACKKNNDSNTTDPVPPIVLPTAPDTLTAGWTKVGSIPIEETVSDVFFTDQNNGYITTDKGIYKSTNAGTDWGKINGDPGFINIAARGLKACFVTSGPYMHYTLDHGVSMLNVNYSNATPTSAPGFQDCFYTSDNICYAASHLYIWKSINGGITFDTIHNFQDNFRQSASLFFLNDLEGWTARNYQLFKTSDGGVSWNSIKTLTNYYGPISYLDANNGYLGDLTSLYKTTNAGSTWQQINSFTTGDTIMDIHFFTPLKGYCVAGTRIYKTIDGGNSWTKDVLLGSKKLIEVFFLDEHHGWACGQYGYVLRFNL